MRKHILLNCPFEIRKKEVETTTLRGVSCNRTAIVKRVKILRSHKLHVFSPMKREMGIKRFEAHCPSPGMEVVTFRSHQIFFVFHGCIHRVILCICDRWTATTTKARDWALRNGVGGTEDPTAFDLLLGELRISTHLPTPTRQNWRLCNEKASHD